MPGAESCVPTQELARDVELRLGRRVFVSASQADVSIEGRVERRAQQNRWHATIILRDANGTTQGTRVLDRTDASCDGLREQLALVIAVMIDPDAALAHPVEPQPAPTSTQSPPTQPAPTPAAPIPAPPATTSSPQKDLPPPSAANPPANAPASKKQADPWFAEASAAAFAAAGLTPNLAAGVGASTLLEAPKIPIALDGSAAIFFDNTATVTSPNGAAAATTFTLAYLSGGLCPVRARGERLHVFACLVSQLGFLRARSQGFAVATDDKLAVLYNIGIEGRASLRIAGPFAVRAGFSGVVPIVRSPFLYERGDGTSATLFQVAPIALTGDLGIGFEFP